MPIPTLHYEKAEPITLAQGSQTTADLIAKLAALFEDHGYTVEQQERSSTLEAIACTPPEAAVADQRLIFAAYTGSAPDPSPTMNSNHATREKQLLMGHCRHVPGDATFEAWHDGNPFAGSDFTGFVRAGGAVDTADLAVLHPYMSPEAMWLIIQNNSGLCAPHAMGALLDPIWPENAEPNGRAYALYTMAQGSLNAVMFLIAAAWSGTTLGAMLVSNAQSNQHRLLAWNPLNDQLEAVGAPGARSLNWPQNGTSGPGQRQIKLPIPLVGSGRLAGVLRNCWMYRDGEGTAEIDRVLPDGTRQLEGWIVSRDINSLNHALLIGA
jgi:hypothetical protein